MLSIAWLIPILPFLSFAVLVLSGSRIHARVGDKVAVIAIAGIAACIPISLGCLVSLILGAQPYETSVAWLNVGASAIHVGFLVDPICAAMLTMVSIVATCIQVYSVGYMHGDPRFSRFFAYLSLFCASMMLLLLSNNFIMLYAGWELVGLCSYLLIGFWFERDAAANAAKKAFITTRVGDVGFAIGIVILFSYVPTLLFRDAFAAATSGHIPPTVLGVIAACLFCGAIGKSAQFPLHTWLPDAMEGPTPVSALIHAATMVAAGVFMVARLYLLFYVPLAQMTFLGMSALMLVGVIGLITALMAATMGVVQRDIKRVLAYSTISQLGFMMASLGLGVVGFTAGVFHLIAHAFFKALLFLGSGSVIHGCHEEQNIWKMGGLAKKMPVTWWTFAFGTLALAGIFPFAGFWSKDEILAGAWANAHENPVYWVFFIGLELAAFLTAFYMGRLCFLAFMGKPRDAVSEHAHESPAVMLWPLRILAVFALLIGLIGIPGKANLFGAFIHFVPSGSEGVEHEGMNFIVAGLSTALALAGLLLSGAIYYWKVIPVGVIKRPLYPLYYLAKNKYFFDEIYAGTAVAGTLLLSRSAALVDKYVIDGAVNLIGWGTRVFIVGISGLIDKYIVDGAVNLVGWMTKTLGEAGARLQTGLIQEYIMGIALFASGIAAVVYVVVMFMK
jgi:NADH-quinone oxidoreductase subunit L